MSTTNLSQRTHIWSHVAVIIFHVIIASMWIVCNYQLKQAADTADTATFKRWYITSYVLASILGVVAILGLVPIVMKRNDTLTITPA